jgi:hypothetical protein
MKELRCLYAVDRDIQEDLSIDELCRRAVEHLVSTMRFPEITVAVIELNGKRFTSENYAEGLSHALHAEIRVEGEVLGHLRVYYAQEKPFILPEEQNLVDGVAEALSMWLERERVEEALRQSEQRYQNSSRANLAGAYLTKPDGTILDFNDAMMRMLGTIRGRNSSSIARRILCRPGVPQGAHTPAAKTALSPAKRLSCKRKDRSVLMPRGGGLAGGRADGGRTSRGRHRHHRAQAHRRGPAPGEQQFKGTFGTAIGIATLPWMDILQCNSRFCEVAGTR